MRKDTHATRRDVLSSVVDQQWRGVRVAEDMHSVDRISQTIVQVHQQGKNTKNSL